MFLLNLSLPEFLALFGAVSGVVVTLYLLSRSRRRQVVPTLRFWVHAQQPVASSHRRRIQQPWSLLLQLISLALLLLAIAQPQIGDREGLRRDHILLLDASSWTAAKAADGKTILDEVQRKARAWVRSLPASDRVMVVRTSNLPSPVTGMEPKGEKIERAILETRSGAAALDLDQAFLFAAQMRQRQGSTAGEIVYVGPGRTSHGGVPAKVPPNLRIIPVEAAPANAGLVSMGARRSESDPEQWDITVAVRNYAGSARRVPLALRFGGAPAGSELIDIPPRTTESRTFRYRTRAAGWMEARLVVNDGLIDDNRAILELPALKPVRVAVFTAQPDSLRPMLEASPNVRATYAPPAAYSASHGADLVIADSFAPSPEPSVPVIYIQPPAGSPFRTRVQFSDARLLRWRADHPVTAGIRVRDHRLPSGQVFGAARNDVAIAEVDAGPVVLIRPEKRAAALGFHPGQGDLKFDLTTPLLIANLLRWAEPSAFRVAEVHGQRVGAVTATLDSEAGSDVRVLSDGKELPFTARGKSVSFFAAEPGMVRVLSGNREQVYSLSLPDIGESEWTPPQSVRRGIPNPLGAAIARDLWQWLAILGVAGLLAEWLIYGRRRAAGIVGRTQSAPEGIAVGSRAS